MKFGETATPEGPLGFIDDWSSSASGHGRVNMLFQAYIAPGTHNIKINSKHIQTHLLWSANSSADLPGIQELSRA